MATFSSLLVHPLATCFYGILGGAVVSFWLMKWQMKKQAAESNIKILHDVQGPIDIGSGLTSLFPNVQLIYNDKKIDYKIQYITGTIKNIDEKRTVTTSDQPFEFKLPENCEVLEAKILEAPKEEIQPINKGNIVEITTPKTILPQEQIKYCILYKSPDKVGPEIYLETRIANVEIIKKGNEADISKVEKNTNIVISSLFVFLFGILFYSILLFSFAIIWDTGGFSLYEPIYLSLGTSFFYILGYLIYRIMITFEKNKAQTM